MRVLGFRWRMLLLVAATLLPFALYIGYQAALERDEAIARALDDAEAAAQRTAAALDDHVARVSTLLAAIEPLVAEELGQPMVLNQRLRRIYPGLSDTVATLSVFALDGRMIASGRFGERQRAGVNVADRAYFRAVLQTRAPAISEPFALRSNGDWAVVMGRPVLDDAGEVRAVLSIATSLEAIDRILEANSPGAGAQVSLATSRGTSMARWPASGEPRGSDLRSAPHFRVAGDGQRFRGEVVTQDGVARIGASVPVSRAPWQVFVGVPRDAVLAAVFGQTRSHLLIGAAMLLASLLTAWRLARGLGLPVLRLRRAVRELASSGVAKPVDIDADGDLRELVDDINGMARSLAEAQSRLRSLVTLSSDWYWETDAEFRFTSVEGTAGSDADVSWIVGRHYTDCGLVHADPEAHARILAERRPYRDEEFRRLDAQGRVLVVMAVSGEPRFGADGSFLGYRGASRDVTERCKLQDSVHNARERLRLIVDAVPGLIAYIDQDERYVFCNRQYAAMVGSEPRLLVGRTVREVVGRTAYALFRQGMRRALEGENASFDVRLAGHDGVPRDFLVHYVPDRDAAGTVLGLVGMVTDVTEMRAGQSALAKERDRLARIIDTMAEGLAIIDARGCYVLVNPVAAAVFGVERDAFNGLDYREVPFRRMAGATLNENIGEHVFDSIRAGALRVGPIALQIERHDGVCKHLSLNAARLHDESGAFAGVVATFVDVTESVRSEARIAESEARFRSLFELSQDGIAIHRVGQIERANAALAKLVGCDRPERLVGMHIADLMAPECRDGVRERTARVLRGDALQLPYVARRMQRLDGSTVEVESAGTLLGAPGSDRMSFVVRDLSERVAHEREITKLNEELDRRVQERTAELRLAYRDMEAFSYNVSHDLRAPLRAMAGFSAILAEDYGADLPREALRLLDRVVRNADRMEQLIEGLLAFGRLSRQPLSMRKVRVRELVDEVIDELAPVLGKRRDAIRIGALPDGWGDPVLLRVIYANLVSNALKYSSKCEHPRIDIGAIDEHPGPTYFVRDNGAGFDMAHAGKLFGMFQRLHAPAEFEGNGVGLAMVRRIVERHGGEIWAESSPGKGAAFYFRLDGRGIARDAVERPRGRVELREVARDGNVKPAVGG